MWGDTFAVDNLAGQCHSSGKSFTRKDQSLIQRYVSAKNILTPDRKIIGGTQKSRSRQEKMDVRGYATFMKIFSFLSIGSKHFCFSVNKSDSFVPRPRIPNEHRLS